MSRRIVITGMGLVTPLGCGVEHCWSRLIAGESGVVKIPNDYFDTVDSSCKIAGIIPRRSDNEEYGFDIDDCILEKERKKLDKFSIYALASADQALKDANWHPGSDHDKDSTGVMLGTGMGGLHSIEKNHKKLLEGGVRKVSPFFLPSCLINLASGNISIKYGLKGPNLSVVTACATGAHAIGMAMDIIRLRRADVMIAGGSEATVTPLGIGGFCAMKALSTRNDYPSRASSPWNRDRDGFVMGEGSGVLILEEYEHAKRRGAKIYCEVAGYGMSGDAYHLSAPHPDGAGMQSSMRTALKDANVNAEDVDYINAHGTSTPLGDAIEIRAVNEIFGDYKDKICMSSTKSSTGHLLGAAGAVEAIFSILAMQNGIVPPTLNLNNVDDGCGDGREKFKCDYGFNLVPHKAQSKDVNVALSNSFGFGGTNATVIFKKID